MKIPFASFLFRKQIQEAMDRPFLSGPIYASLRPEPRPYMFYELWNPSDYIAYECKWSRHSKRCVWVAFLKLREIDTGKLVLLNPALLLTTVSEPYCHLTRFLKEMEKILKKCRKDGKTLFSCGEVLESIASFMDGNTYIYTCDSDKELLGILGYHGPSLWDIRKEWQADDEDPEAMNDNNSLSLEKMYKKCVEDYIRKFGFEKFETLFWKVERSNKAVFMKLMATYLQIVPGAYSFRSVIRSIPYFWFSHKETRALGALIILYRWNSQANWDGRLLPCWAVMWKASFLLQMMGVPFRY